MPGRPFPHARAHALLIEDDPVSQEFLGEAVAAAGWQVELAADVASALRMAQQSPPGLILCDIRLPDGDAFDVARALWPDAMSLLARPYAIALSAEIDEALRTRLHHAGFSRVFRKPVSLSHLLDALPGFAGGAVEAVATTAPIVAKEDGGRLKILDDETALSVCGNMQTVEALRELLANELDRSLDAIRIAQASDDASMLRDALHRLRSSCGFCGAAALGAAVAEVRIGQQPTAERASAVARVLERGAALAMRLADRNRRGSQK